jgi:hypothetical protein
MFSNYSRMAVFDITKAISMIHASACVYIFS